MATILVVEDDANTRLLIHSRLKPYYTVLCAADGQAALDLMDRQSVDLIVADILMPRMDGTALLRTLRADGNPVPILMLTALQSMDDKRESFALGADDYMTKPVHYEELHWRIQALLRRSRISSEKKITIGKVCLHSESYTIVYDGERQIWPRKEFELLYKLLSYPGVIFTKTQLMDSIWGYDSESGDETVKTHISRIRNKCKDMSEFRIVTVKGLGYKADIVEGEKS